MPQITATLGEPAPDTASATPAASTVPGLTASMPPDGQQVRGERRADVVLGQRAERQQQHLRARPVLLQVGIGAVPQRLEPGRVTLDSRFQVVRRQRRFGQVWVFVDTGERGAPVRDVVDPAVAHLGDLLGDEVPGLDEAAPLLDLPEMRPRLLGEPLGEVLNEPRPGRGIEHPPDMGFLQQQQLGVTGDPPREAGRDPRESAGDRDVERLDEHGVSTTDTRPESRQRGAQHVHPRVALGHHRQRRDSVHGRGAAVGFPDNLGNPRPKLARSTQLRDGHELVVVGGESETDLPQRIPNTKAAAR